MSVELKEETDKKHERDCILLIISCFMFYVFSIAVKNCYSTEIVEIIDSFHITKTEAGLTTTLYFAVYAVMQFVYAKIINKINIAKWISIMCIVSSILFFCCGFFTNIKQFWVTFLICGVLHAGAWPTCSCIMGRYLTGKHLKRMSLLLSLAFYLAFVLDYIMSALFVEFLSWRVVFWVTGIGSLVFAILFFSVVKRFDDNYTPLDKKQSDDGGESILKNRVAVKFLIAMCGCVLMFTCLYYSLSGWVPNVLHDVFSVPASMSILFTLVIPVGVILGPIISSRTCDKHDFSKVSILFSIVVIVFLLVLTVAYKINMIFTLFVLMLFLILSAALRNIFSVQVVVTSRWLINTGVFASLLNGFSSIGAAFSPTVAGAVIEQSGYRMLFIVNIAVAVIGIAVIYVGKTHLDKLIKNRKEEELCQ